MLGMTSGDSAATESKPVSQDNSKSTSLWLKGTAVFAILFGLLSIMSGGAVLFSGEAAELAGAYIDFVLWSNFLGGFLYAAAGFGIWFKQRWAVPLAILIAIATILVFAAFGMHIAGGARFEMRTVQAMTLRVAAWLAISFIAYRGILRQR
jgi:hypothetical protein